MEKKNLCEGVIAHMMEEEAWKNISCDFPFTQEQLEKHADKIDWEGVSGNSEILVSTDAREVQKQGSLGYARKQFRSGQDPRL